MLDEDTIAACSRLMGLYEGVSVERSMGHRSGKASFHLRITEPASVARLAYCASVACVDFLVWPVGHACVLKEETPIETDWASPNRIRYQLRAELSQGHREPELKVVVLCVCMADQLGELGLLGREEVCRLRRRVLLKYRMQGLRVIAETALARDGTTEVATAD